MMYGTRCPERSTTIDTGTPASPVSMAMHSSAVRASVVEPTTARPRMLTRATRNWRGFTERASLGREILGGRSGLESDLARRGVEDRENSVGVGRGAVAQVGLQIDAGQIAPTLGVEEDPFE